ncbi:MAG: PDZ domain-containing protein [Candidatus Brocadiia bacterium]
MRKSFGLLFAGAMMFALVFCAMASAEDANGNSKEAEVRQRVSAVARDGLVVVIFRLQDPSSVLPPLYAQLYEIQRLKVNWTENEPVITQGVLVGNDTVLVGEPVFFPQMVASIEVVFFGGERASAKVHGIMMDSNAWVLKLDKPRENPGVSFKVGFVPKNGDVLPLANLDFSYKRYTTDYFSSFTWQMEGNRPFYSWSKMGDYQLVFNPEGEPVGFFFGAKATSDHGKSNWLAGDFLNSPVLTVSEYADSMTKLGAHVGKDILRVRFEVRNKRAGSDDPTRFGLFVDGNGTLLVPCGFYADFIKNIKRIMVSVDGVEKEATFLGQLKHFSAIFIRLNGFTKPSPLISLEGKPCLMKAFICLSPVSIADRNDSLVRCARPLSYSLGYDDNIHFDANYIPFGSYLFDKEGRCIGLCLEQFKEWQNGSVYDSSKTSDFNGASSFDRPVLFSEILEIAAAPTAHLVPNVKPVSIEEARKVVWFGAELQEINRDIAEVLGVLDETQIGSIGGRIAFVYEGSPAEKAGLKVGDILLVISQKGTTNVIEVSRRWLYTSWWYRSYPWPGQRTRITEELMKWGEGSEIEVKYLHDKVKATVSLKIESAPPDFVAASNCKCHELGFRVKDLTYEVRNFFRLASDFSGVIVYRVESGSKAEVAQLGRFDIVVSINKQAVKNVKDCEAVILKALEEQGETITFEILRLGETRFLEVKKPSKEEILKIREEHKFDTEDEENPENGEAPADGGGK